MVIFLDFQVPSKYQIVILVWHILVIKQVLCCVNYILINIFFKLIVYESLVETTDILYRLDIIPICDIITGFNILTESDISPNIGFLRISATGVACRQGMLTPPDT